MAICMSGLGLEIELELERLVDDGRGRLGIPHHRLRDR